MFKGDYDAARTLHFKEAVFDDLLARVFLFCLHFTLQKIKLKLPQIIYFSLIIFAHALVHLKMNS